MNCGISSRQIFTCSHLGTQMSNCIKVKSYWCIWVIYLLPGKFELAESFAHRIWHIYLPYWSGGLKNTMQQKATGTLGLAHSFASVFNKKYWTFPVKVDRLLAGETERGSLFSECHTIKMYWWDIILLYYYTANQAWGRQFRIPWKTQNSVI